MIRKYIQVETVLNHEDQIPLQDPERHQRLNARACTGNQCLEDFQDAQKVLSKWRFLEACGPCVNRS